MGTAGEHQGLAEEPEAEAEIEGEAEGAAEAGAGAQAEPEAEEVEAEAGSGAGAGGADEREAGQGLEYSTETAADQMPTGAEAPVASEPDSIEAPGVPGAHMDSAGDGTGDGSALAGAAVPDALVAGAVGVPLALDAGAAKTGAGYSSLREEQGERASRGCRWCAPRPWQAARRPIQLRRSL